MLGLVTTKTGELESKDELKRRVEEAARFVDIDQICLSPQCGFASTMEGNDLTAEQQRGAEGGLRGNHERAEPAAPNRPVEWAEQDDAMVQARVQAPVGASYHQ